MFKTRTKHSALICLITLIFIIVSLSSCVNNNPNSGNSGNSTSDKQVPVYQGMSIGPLGNTADVATLPGVWTGTNNGNGNDGDNGNHYGQYKGDHSGKGDKDDEENPFPDNDENENIDEEIKSSLEVVGPASDIYYGESGKDVYIHIYISNPDSFEILSFTINGQKFSNYMFEDGSNMEELILKYNVGDVSGITEYTIDAIKYIDGTEIKDVIINGEQTIKVGIKRDNQVTADISNLNKLSNSVSFDVTITDSDNLIGYSNGSLKAVMYDGDSIVATKDLTVGANSVSFDSLKTGAPYQVAIVGLYDAFDGNGFGINTLTTKTFYTKSVVLFDGIEISDSHIKFGYLWSQDAPIKSITSLSLLKDSTLVQELDPETTEISDLLCGVTYKLIASYVNNNAEESIYLEFTTINKTVPQISIDNVTQTKDSIFFEINELDEDEIGEISVIELIHNDRVVAMGDGETRSFAALMSGNSYTVRVTYTYDLNDGNSAHVIIKEAVAVTDEKVAPDFEIKNLIADKDSLSFDITETDNDGIGEVFKIELINANGTILADDNNVRAFHNILSNCEYTVRVTYSYDMNDGNGVKSIVKSAKVKTLEKATPSIQITGVAESKTDVAFSINEVDVDNVGEIISIELLQNGEVVQTAADAGVRKFESLLSNAAYVIRLTYRYNMNDGSADVIVTKTANAFTQSFSLPYIMISAVTPSNSGITFAIEETDANNAGNISKIELYCGDELVRSSTDASIREFTGLLSNVSYTLKVVYTYNLNDGNGNQSSTREVTVKTLPLTKPNITIDSTDSTKESISFSFNIIDASNIGHIERIDLLINGEIVQFSTDASTTSFNGLLSNTAYTVKVTYAYDLNDGTGVKYIENSQVIKTEAKATPTVSISDQKYTSDSIDFSISEIDVDGVGSVSKIELIHSSGKIIVAESLDARSFTGLLSNNQYTLRITYTYNLNDGKGVQTVTKMVDFTTLANSVPTMEISSSNKTHNSISFSVNITDKSGVGAISKIELVRVATGAVTVAENNNVRSFSGLLSGNKYTVRVTYTYDLNDGKGAQTIVKTVSVTTSTVGAPSVTISNVACDNNSVSFDVKKTDSGNTTTKMIAALVLNGTTVETKVVTGSVSFDSLQYATAYDIVVTTYYNLSDGVGERTMTTTAKFTTPYYTDAQGISYKTYSDGTAEVYKFVDGVTNIVIPKSVEGCKVTSIASSAFSSKKITSISIPSTVKTIGSNAFYSCYYLKTIELEEGLESIGAYAFAGCNPEKLVIPLSVTTIEQYAFYTHSSSYYHSPAHGNLYIKADSKPSGWNYNFMCSSCQRAFWSFDEFVEQDGIVYALSTKNTAEVVTTTEQHSSIIIADEIDGCAVIGIAPRAFYNNQKADGEIKFPTNLTYIDHYAFYGFGRVDNVTVVLPKTLNYVGTYAFSYSRVKNVEFNSTYVSIKSNAFFSCNDLSSLYLPLSAEGYIEETAFGECDLLEFVNIPYNMSIYDNSFSGCDKVYFASLVDRRPTHWGDEWEDGIPVYWSSFIDNQGIVYKLNYNIMYEDQPTMTVIDYVNSGNSSVYISDRVLGRVVWMVGEEAFWDTDITNIYIPNTVQVIAERAFDNTVYEYYQYGTSFDYWDGSYDIYNGLLYEIIDGYVSIFASLPIDNYKYVLYDDYYDEETYQYYDFVVMKLDTNFNDVVIPETIDGMPVGKIGDCVFDNRGTITSITLPSELLSIGSWAFSGCSSLKSINIPASVTYIGSYAFKGCSSLESISIPGGITSISYETFAGCLSLKNIFIPKSVNLINDSAFMGCSNLESIVVEDGNLNYHSDGNCLIETKTKKLLLGCKNSVIPTDGSVTSFGNYAFYGCKDLTSIRIPGHVTSFGYSSFSGCDNLKDAYILNVDAWLNISQSPFGNTNLHFLDANGDEITKIVIPDGITKINSSAFRNAKNVTSIVIPEGVTTIGDYAFYGCTGLTNITIPNSIIGISSYAFDKCSTSIYTQYDNAYYLGNSSNPYLVLVSGIDKTITSCTVNDKTRIICPYAFYYYNKLTTISVPDGITYVGSSAFSGCSALEYAIYDNAKYIGNSGNPYIILVKSENQSSCTIHENTKIIAPSAFNSNYDLTSIVIPDGVITIGSGAFYSCSKLSSITIPSSVKYVGKYAFDGCSNLRDVYIYDIEGWSNITFEDDTTRPGSNITLHIINNDNSEVTEIVIPDGVTHIEDYAFANLKSLVSVTIPASVTSIGNSAFSGCSNLQSVIFADGSKLEIIGNNAFAKCTSLTTIDIPTGVKSFGSTAFSGCTALTSFTIPESVTSIGSNAFASCTGLTSIVIPEGVTHIDNYAFSGCTNLHVYITSIGGWLEICSNNVYLSISGGLHFIDKDGNEMSKITIPEGVTYIGNYAFKDCTNITEVVIPDGVTGIGLSAFSGCSGLTTVVLPDSITSIESSAFYDCSSLVNITIPQNLTSIGGSAFYRCSSITSINIPKTLTNVGYNAFYGCSSLEHIYVTDVNVLFNIKFGDDSFSHPNYYGNLHILDKNGNAVTKIVIPENVKTIDAYAFAKAVEVTEVILHNNITAIGNLAFKDLNKITTFVVPDSVKHIGFGAFKGCTKLASITIPFIGESANGTNNTHFSYIFGSSYYHGNSAYDDTVYVPSSLKTVILTGGTKIDEHAFYECSSIVNITIPASVQSIGLYAFSRCSSLTNVYISDIEAWLKMSYDHSSNFDDATCHPNAYGTLHILDEFGNEVTDLVIPESIIYIPGYSFYNCASLKSVTLHSKVSYIGEYTFANCTNLESITIPEGSLYSIYDYSFKNCEALTSIYIPSGVKYIYEGAFENCSSLTSVTFAANSTLTTIEDSAFKGCSSLTSISIPKSVTSLGASTFYGCTSLKIVDIPKDSKITVIPSSTFYDCSSLESVTFPDNLISIGSNAFNNCTSLKTITIPESVTQIGDYAFRSCSGIESIIVAEGNTVYHSEGNCLIETATNKLILGCANSVIPNYVTSIADYAFYFCSSLTSIVIPEGVTSIGHDAFFACTGLTSVVLPNSVTSIGSYAFYRCSSLTSIVIHKSLTSIGSYAFSSCNNLKKIYYTGTQDEWKALNISSYNINYATVTYNYVPEK